MADDRDRSPVEPVREDAGRFVWIERGVLALILLGLLVGVLAILKPFTTAILFGTALAVALWPTREALIRHGAGRGAAAALLLGLSLLVIALPMLVVAPHLAEQLTRGALRIQAYFATLPAQPAWIHDLPVIGEHLAAAWDRVLAAEGNVQVLLAPYATPIQHLVVGAAQALADSTIQLILSLIVATMFWVNGDTLAARLRDALQRLGGTTARQALDVAAGAIRGVAYGVVGTAAIQAALLAFGLALAGIPGAAMLGFLALLFAISQVGSPLLALIWGGAAWWLFRQDQHGWAAFMIIWGLFISTVDNFIKPWLIGFGLQMPMSLIILGVFGGFLAFGFLGLFIGPTLIAVAFTLLQAWQAPATATPSGSPRQAASPYQPVLPEQQGDTRSPV